MSGKHKIIKIQCSICGREIYQRASRYNEGYKYFCYTCIPEKYHLKCSCGKYFGSNSPSVKLCPECREKQYSIVNCFRCGKELKILKKQITGKNVCRRCNSIINGQKALISYNTSEKGRKKSAEIGRRTIKIAQKYQVENNKIKFCDKCGKETMHLSGVGCMRCHNNSKVMVNATIQRNLYNWRNDPEYRKRISSNLGIEPNFQYKNNVLFYKNIPWEEFKNSFQKKEKKDIQDLAKKFNGFIQPTFRSQESMYWENKSAFEKDLEDKNIGWFSYIKFYIDNKGNSLPLVIGKTGTKLVSNSDTDIIFDYDIDYGGSKRPARMFIKEQNTNWDKTKIIIIPCETEKEALEKEKLIGEKLSLFYM